MCSPVSSLFLHLLETEQGCVCQVFLGSASASLGRANPPAAAGWGGEPRCPLQQVHVCIKYCYPFTTLFPLSHQWPNARVQGKAQQEGCDSMAFPGLARWVMWWGQTPLPWHPSPDPPQDPDTVPPSPAAREGSRMGWEGRQTAPAAAKPHSPAPRASSPGSHLWPWQSSRCLRGGHHCPCWAQPGS